MLPLGIKFWILLSQKPMTAYTCYQRKLKANPTNRVIRKKIIHNKVIAVKTYLTHVGHWSNTLLMCDQNLQLPDIENKRRQCGLKSKLWISTPKTYSKEMKNWLILSPISFQINKNKFILSQAQFFFLPNKNINNNNENKQHDF